MNSITISVEDVTLSAELYDTPTARTIYEALPLQGAANVWGEEIYFDIPVMCGEERDARCEVEVGELGYWPEGPAFCIFFGPTPVSTNDKPRAYSPVNVFGRLTGDPAPLRDIASGSKVHVTKNCTR